MKTKAQTDNEILEGASRGNNEVSEVRVRHTDSVHPIDCLCEPCVRSRFNEEQHEDVVEELDWNVE